jgi:signal peptidase I
MTTRRPDISENVQTDEAASALKRGVTLVPWLSVFLSVLMPGLGHIYCRKWFRSFFFFLFATGFTVLGLVSAWAGFAGMTFLAPIGTFFYLLCMIDAYRCCRKFKRDSPGQPLGRCSVALFVLALLFFILVFSTVVVGTISVKFIGQAVNVETRSMAPTLMVGEKVLSNRQVRYAANLRRGDLVAVYIPGYKRVVEIRRVIALPGEKIAMMGGIVEVNGKQLKEDYIHYQQDPFTYRPDERAVYLKEYLVPGDAVFILSDIRDLGQDSRDWGAVGESRIIGRVDFLFHPPERRRQLADSYLSAITRKLIALIPFGGEPNKSRQGL